MAASTDSGSSGLPGAHSSAGKAPEYFWLWVLCLLGVDYFSTLAYQPSITFEVAGLLGPLATTLVVLLTLAGALPVYWYIAGRSTEGQGSIGLLERLVHGWRGKTLVLLLLGFAATDFIMLKTISLADAAVHVIRNEDPAWQRTLSAWAEACRDNATAWLGEDVVALFNEQLVVTLLLGVLGFVFWFMLRKGFSRKVMALAVPLVGLYLVLNAIIIGSGVCHLLSHPELIERWLHHVQSGQWHISRPWWSGGGWLSIALLCVAFLPNLALGLSGFEMSMILMPQVGGSPARDLMDRRQRIRHTRRVLVVAAVIMSLFLLASVWVTTLLIPPAAFEPGVRPAAGPELTGTARDRALAYLAHGGPVLSNEPLQPWFGRWFGSLYDLTTVLLLCLAGTSVMTALAVLLPQFLLRFGMELKWTHKWGVLLVLFGVINLVVTLWFQASVSAQRGAYAAGVLVLITCACLVSYLDQKRKDEQKARPGFSWRRIVFRLITLVFLAITLAVIVQAPTGLLIALCFVSAILGTSVVFRAVRANELRTLGFDFKDAQSKFLWDSLRLADFPVLVPHRPGLHERDLKEKQIRRDHQLDPDVEIVFVEVEVDDPSNFYQRLLIEIVPEDKRFVIKVTRCVSVAHAVAAIALEMSRDSKPPGLHFGWSEMDLMTASWSYFAFGEGNVPWKVRELIHLAEADPLKRPRVIIG